ncbi:hypothetical protein JF770_06365 [Mycobacterium intracellulare]|uniref:hypothetical protein n=1 Tax=Mycobacterium intracellulare TaxID=1767 RepID=UPI001CD95E68|nr:hypothetical protein [Mycobacterium intracellulare]MCA2303178.1 hypothetical protein [Mycobacterium intracellulare]MCA2346453.1 hypothetical protein [Mycobacterium intracellulare]
MSQPFELTEEFASNEWVKIAQQTDALMHQIQGQSAFPVEPGSEFAADDAQSHPYRVSQCARGFINAGIDHMHALKTLIVDGRTLHSASDWTLMRAALEHFAVAFWVMNPSDRRIRIERALCCAAQNFKDQDKAMQKLLEPSEYHSLRSNLDLLGGIAASAGCSKKTVQGGYTSTAILQYAERETSISPSPHLMWQVCSGFAHGRQWANLGMNDVEINPTTEEGVSAVRTTSEYKRLLAAGRPASILMAETVRLFTERSQA